LAICLQSAIDHQLCGHAYDIKLLPMTKRLLQEPLIHFTIFALLIFGAYALISPQRENAPDQILLTVAKIDQIASLFAKTWQREPTVGELKGLVDDYVKEEIYYREAKELGLDTDDMVIRRRLRQKIEFLHDAAVDTLTPTDAELGAYLKAHLAEFGIEPMLAFQQVFLNPERHGDRIDKDAAAILETLRINPATDPATQGDASLLPAELPLTGKTSIGQTFGAEFTSALEMATPGQWTGPIRSEFGLHIVRVAERRAGRTPALGEVRDAVLREWSSDKRKELEDSRFNELLKRYEVTIESPSGARAAQ
jgi:PPIC-type PPIASE domain